MAVFEWISTNLPLLGAISTLFGLILAPIWALRGDM